VTLPLPIPSELRRHLRTFRGELTLMTISLVVLLFQIWLMVGVA
jgi:hypothetical protein